MRYGSVCSGIEAATMAWHPLGWKAAWFSEIEPFPCRMLTHYYPDIPNLGDMLKLHEKETFNESNIDLLVGGTPCQSFSTAGLRAGLDSPNGNLALQFCRILAAKRPRWFVWENVPGVLSSKGGEDFISIMDAFEECGYICDVDILDAQFFGVPQRRKRVFVCGQHRDDLVSQRTNSSALTISQCVVEILHSILIEVSTRSGKELQKSEQTGLSKDGRIRRMKLFGIATENCNYKKLQKNLIDAFLRYQPEVRTRDLGVGKKALQDSTAEDLLVGSPTDPRFLLTEESLKQSLVDILPIMKSFTTSISINSITHQEIYTFLKAGLLIGRLICRLSGSSPSSCQAVLSFLTFTLDITNYARQSNRNLFEQLDGVQSWGDLIRETRHTIEFVGHLGDDWRPPAAVLFEPQGLRRHLKKGRKEGQIVAALTKTGVGASGADDNQAQAGHLIAGTIDNGVTAQLSNIGDPSFTLQKAHFQSVCYDNWGGMFVRKFTPLECERLQGFPLIENKIKIQVCPSLDQVKNFASVENQNPRLQKYALPVGINESNLFAKNAEKSSSVSLPEEGVPVALNVLIDLEHQHLLILSAGKLLLSVRTAEKEEGYPLLIPVADFVHLSALMPAILGQTVRSGKGELLPSIRLFMEDLNGKGHAVLSGPEIDEYVNDVPLCTRKASECSRFTISPDGANILSLDIFWKTWSCCVTAAINSFIPKEIQQSNSYEIELSVTHGYTAIPGAADSPRYEAIGNSMAIPVMRWIGERIDKVDKVFNPYPNP